MTGGSFVNIEEADKFLTSGDRQRVILHFLNTLRAESGEEVADIKFREGEAISESDQSAMFVIVITSPHPPPS